MDTTRGTLYTIEELAAQWQLSVRDARIRAERYMDEHRVTLYWLVWFKDDSESAPPIAIRPYRAGHVPNAYGTALQYRHMLAVLFTGTLVRDRIRPFDVSLVRPPMR